MLFRYCRDQAHDLFVIQDGMLATSAANRLQMNTLLKFMKVTPIVAFILSQNRKVQAARTLKSRRHFV